MPNPHTFTGDPFLVEILAFVCVGWICFAILQKMSDCRKMKPSSAIIWKIDITIRWFSYFLSLTELTFSLLEDALLLSRRMKIKKTLMAFAIISIGKP